MFNLYAGATNTGSKYLFFVLLFVFVAATTGWCEDEILTFQNKNSDAVDAVSQKEALIMQEREAYFQEKLKIQESLQNSATSINHYSISDLQKPVMKVTIASISTLGMTVPPSFSDFIKLLKTKVVQKLNRDYKVLHSAGDPSDPSTAGTST